MGGVEDDEPVSKRMKVSSDLRSISANLSVTESVCSSLGDKMARPVASKEDDEMIGSKGVVKRVEFVKIITKALYSLGYEKSGALLEEESGIPLQSSVVNLFQQFVLGGKWDKSLDTLRKICLLDTTTLNSASSMILEQKFFEQLANEKSMDALKTLRTEIAPVCSNKTRLHKLVACIVSPSQCVLLGFSGQDSLTSESRSKLLVKLQKLLPPTVMIPDGRLEHLVEQAVVVQRKACVFHNGASSSLYSDDQCGKTQIPSRTLQVLHAHQGEVWFLQFSHDGKFLASSSNDHSAIIWEVNDDGAVFLKHVLTGHLKPVLTTSWSPDNRQLLTCGMEEAIRRWDVNTGECLHIYEKAGLGIVSCDWFPDGKQIISGLTDKSLCIWDLDGKEADWLKGHRTLKISDIAITSDGKRIITMYRESSILIFDRQMKIERLIEEEANIISFSVSRDNRFLLISLSNEEIHLWSIDGDYQRLMKFKGHKRSRFIVRSCFGGFEQAFIASGSEDSLVYVWHRSDGDVLMSLTGHAGAINCVSWNPAKPDMLASASDDHTIRIWGLKRVDLKHKKTYNNGVFHQCNGGTS